MCQQEGMEVIILFVHMKNYSDSEFLRDKSKPTVIPLHTWTLTSFGEKQKKQKTGPL